MTKVEFFAEPAGFYMSGHSSKNGDDEQGKLVCSAVSSAAYMAANTITEIIGDTADITVNDAEMRLTVCDPSDSTLAVLAGLQLH